MMTPGSAQKEAQSALPGVEARKLRVYACEDSQLMREYIVTGLDHFGIAVLGVPNGASLDQTMQEQEPDIVILDIGLPGEDGYAIAERLRRERPHVGIIMLTARDRVDDRVKGLDCGADLFFAKPVDLRELASAIGSLHRRLTSPAAPSETWRLDALKSCLVTPMGISIDLTDNELRFLIPLLERPGEVVNRDDLSRALDQRPDLYAMRRMETMISRLRTKVEKASPDEPLPVRARHGRGYAFLSEVER
jgi:DNA-binding response OmpR family regulator